MSDEQGGPARDIASWDAVVVTLDGVISGPAAEERDNQLPPMTCTPRTYAPSARSSHAAG